MGKNKDVFDIDTNDDSPYFGADPDDQQEDEEELDFGNDFNGDADDTEEDPEDGGVDDIEDDEDRDEEAEEEEKPEDEEESEEEPSADDKDGEEEGADDTEDEPEPQPTPEPKGKKASDDKKNRRSPFIPRARFDQVNNKLNEAQRRLRELESQLENQQTFARSRQEAAEADAKFEEEVAAAQEEIYKLTLDGDVKEAARKQLELNQKILERDRQRVREEARREVVQSFEEREYNKTIARLEAEFPFINPDDKENYDEAMVRRIQTISRSLIREEGYSAAEAVQEATETVAARFYPELLGTGGDGGDDGVEETAPRISDVDRKAKTAERRKTSLQRKAEAANRQPPRTTGRSSDKPKEQPLKISEMTEEEFDALTEAELKRLRGDII